MWESEEIFHSGDAFLRSLEQGIRGAQSSIEFQTYIYEPDTIGQELHQWLIAAHQRGVAVRLLIDGIGSPQWAPTEYPTRIYHPTPWQIGQVRHKNPSAAYRKFFESIRKLNTRNHRKFCIIDRQKVWIGSMNVCNQHFEKYAGPRAWRDTAAHVRGESAKILHASFEKTWKQSKALKASKKWRIRMPSWLLGDLNPKTRDNSWVRLNDTRSLRKKHTSDLCYKIRTAQTRVWITNAYFVPPYSILRALTHSALRGKDVRLLLPGKSDVRFVRWVSHFFYPLLTSSGVKIYEYKPRILHAKTILIDQWAMIGSSNLNYRSLIHDLEADIIVSHERSLLNLTENFLADLKESILMTPEALKQQHPWYMKLISFFLSRFRYWI